MLYFPIRREGGFISEVTVAVDVSDFATYVWKRTGKLIVATAVILAVAIYHREGIPSLGAWWDLIRIAIVFGVVTVLIRKNWDVGAALLAAAISLGLLFPISAKSLLRALTFGATTSEASDLHKLAWDCLVLAVAAYLINILGALLAARNALRRFMESLEHLVRDARYVGAMIAAAIGVLPTPGGALITAPFVAETRGRVEMNAEECVLVDYWFRHIWEYWWPLFPAIIYILQMYPSIKAGTIALAHVPLTIASVLLGWFFILRRLKKPPRLPRPEGHIARQLLPIADTLWPLVGVFVVVALAPKGWTNEVFVGALVFACMAIIAVKEMTWADVRLIVKKIVTPQMGVLILGVYVLRGMFDTTQAAKDVPPLLTQSHIPIPVVCFVVPWIVGLLTGYTFAGVATTFGLLTEFIAPGGGRVLIDRLMLAYVGSYTGVMMSPVHLCLVLTRDYFEANLAKVYRRLVPLYIGSLVAVAGLWLVLRHFA